MEKKLIQSRQAKRAALFAGGAGAALAYLLAVRPWHLQWGATDAEFQKPLPGDEIVPNPGHINTHAVTIHAAAADVWPWLAQMGQVRGGFYSYDWLENLIGCNIHNADRILPEHQQIKAGDTVRMHPKAPPLPVIRVDPRRAIVLGGALGKENSANPDEANALTWGFYLEALDENTTRLLCRSRWSWKPNLPNWIGYYALLEPIHFIMERKMLLGIKERAERCPHDRAERAQQPASLRSSE